MKFRDDGKHLSERIAIDENDIVYIHRYIDSLF